MSDRDLELAWADYNDWFQRRHNEDVLARRRAKVEAAVLSASTTKPRDSDGRIAVHYASGHGGAFVKCEICWPPATPQPQGANDG